MTLPDFFRSFNCASAAAENSSSLPRKHSKRGNVKRNASNLSAHTGGATAPPPDLVNNANQADQAQADELFEGKSFFEIGRYKVALKRCDNGAKLATDLSNMISERAKLEDNYGKSLKQWRNKWSIDLNAETNEEYGETMKDAWLALLEAGSKTGDVHIDLSKKIISEPITSIKEWLKTNYQKHIFSYEKTKEFEKNFKEAQLGWSTLFKKMKDLETEYKEAIEHTTSSIKTCDSAQTNPKCSNEQRYKLADKVDKAKATQSQAREKYKQSVTDLSLHKQRYVDQMEEVFDKTQHFEQERMLFFKNIFVKCRGLFQIQDDDRFEELFTELKRKLDQVNPGNDLAWWKDHYGTGTKCDWPQFIDYEAED